uniref:50S ribosomal protein L20 n=1 Tax=Nitzschia alba TaxID=2858 RepID=A0A5C0F4U3_NITAL|nr:50S ribosomal protein L20 [Nitzschia alba]QEI59577.1 50S ribosomal protein L20 [Nitzschia alba]
MIRIKRGNISQKKHKKILTLAKSYVGAHSTLFRIANQQVIKALKYSYKDRKCKKRIFRKIWITRINASTRFYKIPYSQFIHKLKKANILINRKLLSQITILDTLTFNLLLTAL